MNDKMLELPESNGSRMTSSMPESGQRSSGFLDADEYRPGWLDGALAPPQQPPETGEEQPEPERPRVDPLERLSQALERYYEAEPPEPAGEMAGPLSGHLAEETPVSVSQPRSSTTGASGPSAPEDPLPRRTSAETGHSMGETPGGSEADAQDELAAQASETVAAEPPGVTTAQRPDAPDAPDVVDQTAGDKQWIEVILPAATVDAPPEIADADSGLGDIVETAEPHAEETPPLEEVTPAVVDDTLSPVEAEPLAAPPEPPVIAPVAPRHRKVRSRLSSFLVISGLLLLGLAALIYLVNPFFRLALSTASLARPVESTGNPTPRSLNTDWCATGDFVEGSAEPLLLRDNGTQGDLVSNDLVYSAELTVPTAGEHRWQVTNCDDESLRYPTQDAWFVTSNPNERVTLVFDAAEREYRLFFPISYVLGALDSAGDFRVVGNFQDWNAADPTGTLDAVGTGLYQQIRRIAQPGIYQAHIIAGNENLAFDSYGRTTDPIPFSFETEQIGEYVVFLLDTGRGRASVLYDFPALASQLAFGAGYVAIAGALALLGLLLLLWALVRWLVLRRESAWLDAGCPRCHEQELMRISRRAGDRVLHAAGFPLYRYRCRNCTWEGVRLSVDGAPVSPGLVIASPVDY